MEEEFSLKFMKTIEGFVTVHILQDHVELFNRNLAMYLVAVLHVILDSKQTLVAYHLYLSSSQCHI